VLLLQCLQARNQWGSNLQVLILRLIFMAISGAIDRYFHLLDRSNDTLCLLGHLILLGGDLSYLIMKGLGERSEQLYKFRFS